MAPPQFRLVLASAAAVLALALVACSGGSDEADPTDAPLGGTTPIPTASPLPLVPVPTILDTSGGVSTDDTAQPVTYVVVAGDSLSLIADEFETTIEAIVEANALDSSDIFVGQQLVIPGTGGGTAAGPAATPTPAPTGGVQTYIVQAGDSGFGIALEFNTTLEALAAANGLSVDDLANLQIGQELMIPSP